MILKNALISVSNREGLVPFARILARNGIKLYATGGTARLLKAGKVPAREISSLTHFPEILDGRVKTLHPAVFAGLLARPKDQPTLDKFKFPRMDLLVCNFYDFPSGKKISESAMADHIDIGGVALVRAAAKNMAGVLTIVSPQQYGEFTQRILSGHLADPEYRRRLAAIAWGTVAQYDLKILSASIGRISRSAAPSAGVSDAGRLDGTAAPRWFFQASEEAMSLRYGENPHQSASFFLPVESPALPFDVIQGKPLSYCNLLDVHAAVSLWSDAPRSPFCAILKHTNPCGAAVGKTPAEAFRRAFAGDPQSAFGGVVLFNRRVDGHAAREMADRFFEVVVAPDYDSNARKIFGCKKALRLLQFSMSRIRVAAARPDVRSALGGMLVQSADRNVLPPARWKRMAGPRPHRVVLADCDLAQRLAKHVKSNSVVLVRRQQAVGIGAGQQSRVDAVRLAIDKARRYGHATQGSACASDGFFPFSDSIELLARVGVAAIVEPGGSIRDADVVASARKRRLSLFFTGRRHFRHG